MTVSKNQAGKCIRTSIRRLSLCTSAAIRQFGAAVLSALLFASPVNAAESRPPILLDPLRETIELDQLSRSWVDQYGTATIAHVASLPEESFQALRSGKIFSTGKSGAVWLNFSVRSAAAMRSDWVIEVPMPIIDLVTVYIRQPNEGWYSQTAGDTVAVSGWPEPGRYPVFHLEVPSDNRSTEVFVRLQHATAISFPVRLTHMSAHEQRAQIEYLGLGMTFGALLLLIIACLAQAWLYRDAGYAWYSAYATLMTVAVAAYTGVAGHLLWSNSGYWSDVSQGVLGLLTGGAALMFVRNLSGISSRYRWLDAATPPLAWLAPIMAIIFMLVDKNVGTLMVGTYLGLVVAVSAAIAILAWRRGDVVGVWVLGAFMPLGAAVILVLLRLFGWLPISFATQYAVVLGSAIEVPLLLVALSIRSRERHGAQIREQALSSQDALTGLLAPHLFHDRLRQAISRYKRHKDNSAIVFIDLVNYRRIKEYHGSAVAEQSLLRSVIKLRRLLRDIDTVSRIGEARFGLILEGVGSRTAVTDRAARLIAAGLMPLKGLKPEVTLQFHVAAALLAERALEPFELNEALDTLMASMSSRTRRPIRFLEPEVTMPTPLELDSLQHEDEDSIFPGAQAPTPAKQNRTKL